MKKELISNVESFMNGDESAYEYIFKEEYAKVYTRIKMNVHFNNEKDVEDVVQDVFVKVYEKIDTLKDVNKFEAWLMTIAVNTANNEIVKQNRTTFFKEIPDLEGVTQEDLLENPYPEFQPERQMTRKELEENLTDILSTIPPQQSMCLQMKEYDGLSYQEIADALEISLSSVKNNIFYAKKKIKTEVEARKLYSVAPITFFLWMYRTYVEAAEVSVEIQDAAWSTQQGLLSGISQGVIAGESASVGTAAQIATTETVKTPGKIVIGKIAATVGIVTILGVAGIEIVHNANSNDTEVVQEENVTNEAGNIADETEKQSNHEEKSEIFDDSESERQENAPDETQENAVEETPEIPEVPVETVYTIENIYVGSSPDVSTELYSIRGEKHFQTDQPVIHYTIAGEEYTMEYEGYHIDGYGYEIGYELEDITGDGDDNLIVSVYCIGNTLHECLQDTYIYSVNRQNGSLEQICKIAADGCEKYAPECPYNIGVYAEEGGMRLDVNSGNVNEVWKTVHLKYQESEWIVDSINDFEG